MRSTPITFTAVIATCLLLAITASSQSTNPSSPTPVNGQYTGKGPSKETNYYFSFSGGPGDISVRLDIKAKGYSTFARIEIGNDPSNLIAMHNMNASTTTGSATVTKEFKLAQKQTVRIKLTLDGNLAEYTLAVKGGIVFSGGGGESTEAGNGKLSSGGGAKLGKVGSAGSKPKTGMLGATGGGQKISLTCPTEIEYQIVPVADWDATIYSKKRLKFDSAQAEGNVAYCTYSANNGASKDSSILTKKAPQGYTCTVYNGGPGNRIIVCAPATTAVLIKPRE